MHFVAFERTMGGMIQAGWRHFEWNAQPPGPVAKAIHRRIVRIRSLLRKRL